MDRGIWREDEHTDCKYTRAASAATTDRTNRPAAVVGLGIDNGHSGSNILTAVVQSIDVWRRRTRQSNRHELRRNLFLAIFILYSLNKCSLPYFLSQPSLPACIVQVTLSSYVAFDAWHGASHRLATRDNSPFCRHTRRLQILPGPRTHGTRRIERRAWPE